MKKVTILFMIFLVIFCFAGCSSEDTSSVSPETENKIGRASVGKECRL